MDVVWRAGIKGKDKHVLAGVADTANLGALSNRNRVSVICNCGLVIEHRRPKR